MTPSEGKIKSLPHQGRLAQLLATLEANTTLLAFLFGLCFVAALLVLAIWFPQPTPFQYTVFRITLALAAAGIAGVIPGMIRLTVKPGTALLIHAGGALAVFVMVYLLAPAQLPKEQPALSSLPPKKKEKPVLNAIKIGQYIDNRDGTITDTKTGLMWKRCLEGLSGVNCEKGKTKEYTWNDAVQRFMNVEYVDYTDWRLPTIDELNTLIYCSNGTSHQDAWARGCNQDFSFDGFESPTINQQAFPNAGAALYVWSGTPSAGNSDGARFVYFGCGFSGIDSRGDSRINFYTVRLVRNGQ